MSASDKQLYLLQLKINIGTQDGGDLPGHIRKVSSLLSDQPTMTKCLHKFKMTGEPKILAVLEVSNAIDLEKMMADIALLGNIEVIFCKPLVPYEEFAKNSLGVDEALTTPMPDSLNGVKQLIWAEFTIEYKGKTLEELLAIWKQGASVAFQLRASGRVKSALFKVSGERKGHIFTASSASAFDQSSFKLPMPVANGNNLWTKTHHLQQLDAYIAEITK